MDLEYHAANHRELPDNGRGRFCLEPDRLDNILIPVSSDNGSKNGLRRPPSTCTAFPLARKRSTACRDEPGSVDKRNKCVCEQLAARASHDPSLSDELIKMEPNRPLPPVFLMLYVKSCKAGGGKGTHRGTFGIQAVRCHIPSV